MKKERCKICSKQISDGFCPDCGLQENYSVAATEKPSVTAPAKMKNSVIAWGIACAFLILLPLLMNTMPFQAIIHGVQKGQVPTAIPTAVYENVLQELAAGGTAIEVTLAEGNYIVGIDIPQGIYEVSVVGRLASIELKDEPNQIDFFSWLQNDSNTASPYLQDVRLYQGATVCIETGTILFTSVNAQADALQALPQNTETKTYNPVDGAIAGVDFPEGTYDIVARGDGHGMVRVSFPESNENFLGFSDVMGTRKGELSRFCNVEFPKGTLLEIADIEIELVPSVRNSLVR